MGNPEGKRTLRRTKSRLDDNIKINLQEVGRGHGLYSYGSERKQVAGSCEFCNELSGSITCGEGLDELRKC